jgi:nucleoside-diphosphate-sugar epimerase
MSNASDSPILVTGAAGCIGAWVVEELLHQGRKPVVLDVSEDRRRLHLTMAQEKAKAVPWITGDISDFSVVDQAVALHKPQAIIHLAALQVPFCRADPVLGAKVNVVGQVNVFEAARRHGVGRVVYASSVAALGPTPEEPNPHTLYGVYKRADEGVASVYAADWGVTSIGLRPHTVYGPGRDQGLTSAPTKAMLAAAAGKPFTIPFRGELRMQYTGEVAAIFVRAALCKIDTRECGVYDLAGERASIEDIKSEIVRIAPGAEIELAGSALPFPTDLSDSELRATIGDWRAIGLAEGTQRTIEAFRALLPTGAVDLGQLSR